MSPLESSNSCIACVLRNSPSTKLDHPPLGHFVRTLNPEGAFYAPEPSGPKPHHAEHSHERFGFQFIAACRRGAFRGSTYCLGSRRFVLDGSSTSGDDIT